MRVLASFNASIAREVFSPFALAESVRIPANAPAAASCSIDRLFMIRALSLSLSWAQ
jgi:hypothetical protein